MKTEILITADTEAKNQSDIEGLYSALFESFDYGRVGKGAGITEVIEFTGADFSQYPPHNLAAPCLGESIGIPESRSLTRNPSVFRCWCDTRLAGRRRDRSIHSRSTSTSPLPWLS